MWQIVILMFLPELGIEQDAVTVTHNDGKVLEFETKEVCLQHMWKNLEKLKEFGSSQFGGAPVKEIGCWKKT